MHTLEKVYRLLKERRSAPPDASYTASLFAKAPESIVKKIGEESAELIAAYLKHDNKAVVHEVVDLWFHTLVLLVEKGDIELDDVLHEFDNRLGISGLTEKAKRHG